MKKRRLHSIPQDQLERRRYFKQESEAMITFEVFLTIIFWGLWAYLIAPLLSLGLWVAGIYLFKDRILSMGGYEAFTTEIVNYSYVVLTMWVILTFWVLWNQLRYGKKNRRVEIPRHVNSTQTGNVTGLNEQSVELMKTSREILMHFDNDGQPVIVNVAESHLTSAYKSR